MSTRGSFQLLAAGLALTLFGCNNATESGAAATDGQDASNAAEAAGDPTTAGETVALSEANTTIAFVGTKDDGRHDGGFQQLNGTVRLNGDAVEAIAVTVQTDSLWADNPKLEGHLKSPDFFEVQAHPELSFASTSIQAAGTGDATHTITGDLTMLDQTHSIDVPATIGVSADKVRLNSEFTIDRTQWGMNYRPEQVHKDVQIHVEIDAAR